MCSVPGRSIVASACPASSGRLLSLLACGAVCPSVCTDATICAHRRSDRFVTRLTTGFHAESSQDPALHFMPLADLGDCAPRSPGSASIPCLVVSAFSMRLQSSACTRTSSLRFTIWVRLSSPMVVGCVACVDHVMCLCAQAKRGHLPILERWAPFLCLVVASLLIMTDLTRRFVCSREWHSACATRASCTVNVTKSHQARSRRVSRHQFD